MKISPSALISIALSAALAGEAAAVTAKGNLGAGVGAPTVVPIVNPGVTGAPAIPSLIPSISVPRAESLTPSLIPSAPVMEAPMKTYSDAETGNSAGAKSVPASEDKPAIQNVLSAERNGGDTRQALGDLYDGGSSPMTEATLPTLANSRLATLPKYIFNYLDELKYKAVKAGQDVVDLGKGSPDLPAPSQAVDALKAAVDNTANHTYPQANGTPRFRQAVAERFRKRFGVALDPEKEVLPLIGSKEGLAHLLLAMLDPGDMVLVPSPGYPAYAKQIAIAGGRVLSMPLAEKDGFLPDFAALEAKMEEAKRQGKVKAMILNYPSNPTGAVVPDLAFLKQALAFARKHELLVLYDNAYSDISFDGHVSPTMLQVPGAKSHVIEFHTLSKNHSMAGFRIGYAVGNPEAVALLAKTKGFFDYGLPTFNQEAAVGAFEAGDAYVDQTRALYENRRNVLVSELRKIGWEAAPPKGAMYLWTKLPPAAAGMSSLEFSERLIREQGVVVSPGSAFGPEGEGYVRISLIQPEARLREAVRRIGLFLASLDGL